MWNVELNRRIWMFARASIRDCVRAPSLARTAAACLLLACSLTAHADFDQKYKAYSGDLDGNGYNDLYLSRRPDLVMIPLDDLIIPIPSRRAEHVILMQNADKTFTINPTPSASDLQIVRTWTQSQVQLDASDINVDGYQDLIIKNFASDPRFLAGTLDQIVYAATSSAAAKVVGVSQLIRDFFEQIYGWTVDRDYFVRTAIDNDWYHLTGRLVTGWYDIQYINFWYTFGNGRHYLDESDDAADPNNWPAYCEVYPGYCYFDSYWGGWQVYGTYMEDIQVVIEYEHFNQDAIRFAQAVGTAYDVPNSSADPTAAENILEAKLGAQIGETVAAVLAYPLPRPEIPPDMMPEPPIQRRGPVPPDANDPDYYPKPKLKWKILPRIPIPWCALLCPIDAGDSNEGKLLEWYIFGAEWALWDILNREDRSAQPKVVIGEGEGGDDYNRIPEAAVHWGALYLSYGRDNGKEAPFSNEPNEDWPDSYYEFMWAMNSGWLSALMGKQALFYDIQLHQPRTRRGRFYPCERKILEGYPLREERYWPITAPFTGGTCEFIR